MKSIFAHPFYIYFIFQILNYFLVFVSASFHFPSVPWIFKSIFPLNNFFFPLLFFFNSSLYCDPAANLLLCHFSDYLLGRYFLTVQVKKMDFEHINGWVWTDGWPNFTLSPPSIDLSIPLSVIHHPSISLRKTEWGGGAGERYSLLEINTLKLCCRFSCLLEKLFFFFFTGWYTEWFYLISKALIRLTTCSCLFWFYRRYHPKKFPFWNISDFQASNNKQRILDLLIHPSIFRVAGAWSLLQLS